MVDVRDTLEGIAPTAHPLDMDVVRHRAVAIAATDQRRHRRRFTAVAAVLVLTLVIAVPTLTRSGELATVAVGADLPDIAGPSVSGQGEVALADFAGEPLLVYVWGPWCVTWMPACLSELTAYTEQDDAVQVVTAAIFTDQETTAAALADAGVDVPTMVLPDNEEFRSLLPADVASQVPLDAVPMTLAFNAAGTLVQVRIGSAPPDVSSTYWVNELAGIAQTAVEYTPYGPVGAVATPPPSPGPISPTPGAAPTEPADRPCDALPDRSGPRLYEVQAGDTLMSIAEAVYGDATAIRPIVTANNLRGDDDLCVGERLIIPDNPATSPEPTEAEPGPTGPDFDPQLADRLRESFLTSLAQGPQARITPSQDYQAPWVVFNGTDESGATITANISRSSLEQEVANNVHGGCPPLTTAAQEGCGQELAEINGRRTALVLFADTFFFTYVEAPGGHVLTVIHSQRPDAATALTPQETIEWISTIDTLFTS